MEGVFEVYIHFDRFQNVDLFRQGLYALRTRVYTIDESKHAYRITQLADVKKSDSTSSSSSSSFPPRIPAARRGIPYRVIQTPVCEILDTGRLTREQLVDCGLLARIDDNNGSFISRTFRIQFASQQVDLNEGCLFRILQDVNPTRRSPVYVDVELASIEMYSSDYNVEQALPAEALNMPIVSRRTFRLASFYEGMNALYPVTMNDKYFSCVYMSIFSVQLNHQYRPIPDPVPIDDDYDMNDSHRSIDHVINNNEIRNYSILPSFRSQGSRSASISIPLERVLFPAHQFGNHELSDPQLWSGNEKFIDWADRYYQFYISSLISSYIKLASFLSQCQQYCINSQLHIDAMMDEVKQLELPMRMVEKGGAEYINDSQLPFRFPRLNALSKQIRIDDNCPTGVVSCIQRDISIIASQTFIIWERMIQFMQQYNDVLIPMMNDEWRRITIESFGSCIFCETFYIEQRKRVLNQQHFDVHDHVTKAVRQSTALLSLGTLPIEDVSLKASPGEHAIIFQQTFNQQSKRQSSHEYTLIRRGSADVSTPTSVHDDDDKGRSASSVSTNGVHLVVMVHGYQGNSWDLRLFRNHLTVHGDCNLMFLSSKANEGLTDDSINVMGARLAQEIFTHIQSSSIRNIDHISFVAHSLGGVIVRSALTERIMKPLLPKCYTYFSLGTPHCGYLFNSSTVLQAGMWLIKKMTKSTCLEQLTLSDALDPRQSVIYRLSKERGLQYFKNVILVASPQDYYAPYASARMEIPSNVNHHSQWGPIYVEMIEHLMSPLEHVHFTRFDVSFKHSAPLFDRLIGRAAHISFLEQPLYILMFVLVFRKYFAIDNEFVNNSHSQTNESDKSHRDHIRQQKSRNEQ